MWLQLTEINKFTLLAHVGRMGAAGGALFRTGKRRYLDACMDTCAFISVPRVRESKRL